ncbi:MAG: Crp/Fnr family transcriptional regulator [Archangiaceae bacterium]|nr:Crp/Fnr family transcriptional regulator [Archangiaceae bacterium]
MQTPLRPPPTELIGALRRHPLWAETNDSSVRAVLRFAKDETFRPGQYLFRARERADSVFLLLEGAARMFYPGPTPSLETEITVVLFRAPAAFGDAEALAGIPWEETVEALTSVRALRIDIERYLEVLRADAPLSARHYVDLATRFSLAIRRAQNTHFGDVTSRLAALLVSYANHFGKPHGDAILIDHPLTRDQLAVQVGSNRRSVADALAALQERKLIYRQGRKFVLASVAQALALGPQGTPISYSSQPRRR